MHPLCHALWIAFLSGAVVDQDNVQPAERQHQDIPKPPPPVAVTTGAVEVTFQGAGAFPEADLRTAITEQVKEIEDQGLTKARADDAAFFLGNFYREHGYAQVEVQWEIVSARRLLLKVAEGPVTLIGKITFAGNRAIADATLEEHLMGATRERFPDRQPPYPVVEADIQTGVETVRGLYASQGYLNATVSNAELTERNGGAQMDISIQIVEGIKYVWGSVSFVGDTILPQAELLVCMGDCIGKPYTPNQVLKAQRDVQYFYKTHGYFNAQVTAVGDTAQARNGRVPVSITVNAGSQYRFGEVTATGLERLDSDFLPDRFLPIKGQLYTPEKAQEKFRDLMRTGLFKNLRLHEEPLPNGEVRLDLTVEEAKSRELGFSLGYSTFEGGIGGITWRDRNLFGQGRPLNAEVKVGQRGLLGEVSYVDPWFLNDQATGRLRLFGTTRTFDGYDKREYGLRAEVTRKLSEKSEISAFAQTRHVLVDTITFAPLAEDQERISQLPRSEVQAAKAAAIADVVGETDYSITSLGLTQSLDLRDSPLNPRRGFLLNSAAEVAADALGDGIAFFRGTVSASYYHPLGKGVLAIGARAGFISPMGDGKIPVDERFFNGGARSVRSFAERELGPADANGLPIGGETFTVFNVEYTLPLYRGLEGAVFFDAGSVGNDTRMGTIRQAVGIGLRYKTPVGPLRLDYGVNPSPREGEDRGALHISIGVAF